MTFVSILAAFATIQLSL